MLYHVLAHLLTFFSAILFLLAKAIYDNKLLECYFTRSFYKHILGILVKYTDMESEDYSFYQGLVYLMENHVSALGYDLTFSAEVCIVFCLAYSFVIFWHQKKCFSHDIFIFVGSRIWSYRSEGPYTQWSEHSCD